MRKVRLRERESVAGPCSPQMNLHGRVRLQFQISPCRSAFADSEARSFWEGVNVWGLMGQPPFVPFGKNSSPAVAQPQSRKHASCCLPLPTVSSQVPVSAEQAVLWHGPDPAWMFWLSKANPGWTVELWLLSGHTCRIHMGVTLPSSRAPLQLAAAWIWHNVRFLASVVVKKTWQLVPCLLCHFNNHEDPKFSVAQLQAYCKGEEHREFWGHLKGEWIWTSQWSLLWVWRHLEAQGGSLQSHDLDQIYTHAT